jgi:hypothetical protein
MRLKDTVGLFSAVTKSWQQIPLNMFSIVSFKCLLQRAVLRCRWKFTLLTSKTQRTNITVSILPTTVPKVVPQVTKMIVKI